MSQNIDRAADPQFGKLLPTEPHCFALVDDSEPFIDEGIGNGPLRHPAVIEAGPSTSFSKCIAQRSLSFTISLEPAVHSPYSALTLNLVVSVR
jgi:hypothetical protein